MSSSSESDDESHLKDSLRECIFNVRSAGSFAVFHKIEDFVSPGVSVDPIHIIGLPLSQDHAHALIQASCQAPFGKGTETLVDESVRKTWEINAREVQFRNNEDWQRCLDRIVERAAKELGIVNGSRDVHAEFYKMLLYKEGAMFKAHQEYVICDLYEILG